MGGSYPHSILLFSALFPPPVIPSVLGVLSLSHSAFPKSKPVAILLKEEQGNFLLGEELSSEKGQDFLLGEELSSEKGLRTRTLFSEVYPSPLSSEAWAQEVHLPLTGVLCWQ